LPKVMEYTDFRTPFTTKGTKICTKITKR